MIAYEKENRTHFLRLKERDRGQLYPFILSAKHHLLDPELRIDPYNVTLYKFTVAERKAWAQRVLSDLEAAGLDLEHDEFVLLAGKKYYEYLLGEGGIRNFTLPLHGHGGIGCILKYLKEQTSKL